jgi:hypothetical protein
MRILTHNEDSHTYLHAGNYDEDEKQGASRDEDGGATGGDEDEDADTILARQKRWGDLNVKKVLNREVDDLITKAKVANRSATVHPIYTFVFA